MSNEPVTLEGLMTLVHRYGNREWQAGYADAEGKEATEQKWRTKADETRNEIRAYAVRLLPAGVAAVRAPSTEVQRFLSYVTQLEDHKVPDDWNITRELTAGDFRAVARALGVAGTLKESGNGA